MKPLRILLVALAVLAGLGIFFLPRLLVAEPGTAIAQAPAAPAPADGGNRSAIEKIVRDYLLNNPGILREMAAKLQAEDRAAASAERNAVFATERENIYSAKDSVVLGNPDGDVVLVEFFDYNCGYCKKALGDTEELLKSEPKLKLVLREMPVLGEPSRDAARVAVAVNIQAPDKYLEFHRRLLASDRADGNRAVEIARELGLDMAKLSAAIADPATDATLVEVHRVAEKLGINGTPTYVIADEVIPGAIGVDMLRKVIANVRGCGKAECS